MTEISLLIILEDRSEPTFSHMYMSRSSSKLDSSHVTQYMDLTVWPWLNQNEVYRAKQSDVFTTTVSIQQYKWLSVLHNVYIIYADIEKEEKATFDHKLIILQMNHIVKAWFSFVSVKWMWGHHPTTQSRAGQKPGQ